ncbi:MAG: DUF4190 domain-containing protein [Lachnospiraceae bacterium]|nr:DUF4190 domain-containing protein [Lachnospiraceae bacterium]
MDNNNMMNNGYDPNQQQPYAGGAYQQPAPQQPSKTKSILALVFGILSIIISCCCTYLGIALGIAGIVMAVLSKKDNGDKMNGMAIAGMVCSIIAIVISVVSIVLVLGGFISTDYISQYLN